MANITCEILYVHSESQAGRNQAQIRVVRWNGGEPQLENREVYMVGDEQRCAKARGITLEQLDEIQKDLNIRKALGGERISENEWFKF